MEYNLERVKAITEAAAQRQKEREESASSPFTSRPMSASGGYKIVKPVNTSKNSARNSPVSIFGKILSEPRENLSPSSSQRTTPDTVEAKSETGGKSKKTGSSSVESSAKVSLKTPKGSQEMISHTDDNKGSASGSKGKNVNIRLKLNVNIGKKKNEESPTDDTSDSQTPVSRKRRESMSPGLPRRISSKFLMPDPDLNAVSRAKEFLAGVQSRPEKTVNPVNETKTSVSVAVRVRPFSTQELKKGDCKRVVFADEEKKVVRVQGKHEFEFTHIFDSFDPVPLHDQEYVYNLIGKPLLDHSLDGFNCCLFAYGATGSGKTYSMTGDEVTHDLENQGIIPRMIEDLFLNMSLDSTVSMNYIEIYNEEIFNLLETVSSARTPTKKFPYRVREHPVFGPYIPNLPPLVVDSCDELLSFWSLGNIRRTKAATACNDHSSRSHAILKIIVEQKYPDEIIESPAKKGRHERDCDTDSQTSNGDRLVSIINLVDLAGSERVAAAQTTGDRFKEGTAINVSLLTLGKIISKLSSCTDESQRSRLHIPYRESTLTFLLKESLGGNSKTCMLATVSPSAAQVEETMSTLRYAAKASRIVNTVRINEDPKIIRIRVLEQLLADVVKELEAVKRSHVDKVPAIRFIDSESSPVTQTDSSTNTSLSPSPPKESKGKQKQTKNDTPKNETPKNDSESQSRKRTKEMATQKSAEKVIKDHKSVNTDATTEPKNKLMKKVDIPPAPKSTLIRDIYDTFEGFLEDETDIKGTKRPSLSKGVKRASVDKESSRPEKLPSPIPRTDAKKKKEEVKGKKNDDLDWGTTNTQQNNEDEDCNNNEEDFTMNGEKYLSAQEGLGDEDESGGEKTETTVKSTDFDWGTDDVKEDKKTSDTKNKKVSDTKEKKASGTKDKKQDSNEDCGTDDKKKGASPTKASSKQSTSDHDNRRKSPEPTSSKKSDPKQSTSKSGQDTKSNDSKSQSKPPSKDNKKEKKGTSSPEDKKGQNEDLSKEDKKKSPSPTKSPVKPKDKKQDNDDWGFEAVKEDNKNPPKPSTSSQNDKKKTPEGKATPDKNAKNQGKKKSTSPQGLNQSDTFMSAADASLNPLNTARLETSDLKEANRPSIMTGRASMTRTSVCSSNAGQEKRKTSVSLTDTYETSRDESRHVNFRDTVVCQSYEVSMSSTSSLQVNQGKDEDEDWGDDSATLEKKSQVTVKQLDDWGDEGWGTTTQEDTSITFDDISAGDDSQIKELDWDDLADNTPAPSGDVGWDDLAADNQSNANKKKNAKKNKKGGKCHA